MTDRHPDSQADLAERIKFAIWTLVLGSGFRLPVDVMGAGAAGRVRAALLRRMEQEGITEVVTDVLYARAKRV